MSWLYKQAPHILHLLSFLITCIGAHETRDMTYPKPTLMKLSDHLLQGYKKWVRPVYDWRQMTTVYLEIKIYMILGVNEKHQQLTTYMWCTQYWTDEFLTWDPAEFDNVTKISIPIQMIWAPDVMIVEFVEAGKTPDIPYLYVNYKGIVTNDKPIQVVTSCSLNIYIFPYDIQNCTISFTSWVHTIEDINLSEWASAGIFSIFRNNGEWELLNVLTEHVKEHDHGDTYSVLKYHVVIKRRPLFYEVNLLLPSTFLMILDIFGFYLPPDCGERVSFKITLLLGYSVFLLIVTDMLPATSVGTPIIGIFYSVCLGLLVISMAETIIIIRIVNKKNFQPQVPKWLKKLLLKVTALCCIKGQAKLSMADTHSLDISLQSGSSSADKLTKDNKEHGNEYEILEEVTANKAPETIERILQEISTIRKYLLRREECETADEWLQVGYVLDSLLFRVYLLVILAYAVTLATMWIYWRQN
ncbi:5-hydroxytryptamine receptor 3A [Bombina bombina]|uniref:5-hydroxytryptamine receptor 3A n=1 Tax=Bombina bombina TaxID=8345 RepID=UPI00235A554E|nr:5-hydroxytryptamine receptor 3A [Bombina bombina]